MPPLLLLFSAVHAEGGGEEVGVGPAVFGNENIVKHGLGFPQADILEGAGHAQLGDGVRGGGENLTVLSGVKDELATSLPYGKQRRLEIARALATEPKLLLLDEPAAGMNPQETNELTAFIGEIRDRFHLTVFLIEHHMNLVMNISDRIYVLDFGKLIAQGDPAAIQNDKRVIDAYLGGSEDA